MYSNKELELWNITEGHKGENNVWIKGTEAFVKNITVDMQPYSSELLKKEYGLDVECTKRLFREYDGDIREGSVLKDTANGISYLINSVLPWDDHIELMCKEI